MDNPMAFMLFMEQEQDVILQCVQIGTSRQANEYRFFEKYWKNELHKDKIPNFYEDSSN